MLKRLGAAVVGSLQFAQILYILIRLPIYDRLATSDLRDTLHFAAP